MSHSQKSVRRPSRLLMTVLAALTVSAISLFYLNFFSSRESATQQISPPVKTVSGQSGVPGFHPESSEVVKPLYPVNGGNDPVKASSAPVAFVTPPVPGMLPKSVECTMDNETGGTLECESGSVVIVPPGTFVDAKGNAIKEKVKISFTEYRDYKDIFFSGIPMVYYAKNKAEQFESAGMMQLEANTDNGLVYMNKDKRIRVMLASADAGSGYDLYYFDKKKGGWRRKVKTRLFTSHVK